MPAENDTHKKNLHPFILQHDIRAVLFDHDDTLVATFEAKSRQHIQVAAQFYNRTLTREIIVEHWGKPLPELVKILYDTNDVEEALAYNRQLYHHFPKVGNPGVVESITRLRQTGIMTGVVTATVRSCFDHDCKNLAWSQQLFDYIQTAENTSVHKPNPRVFEPALQWLSTIGISPQHTLYIGDGLHDMHAAKGAGLHFIGVCTGFCTREIFDHHQVFTIPSVRSIIEQDKA